MHLFMQFNRVICAYKFQCNIVILRIDIPLLIFIFSICVPVWVFFRIVFYSYIRCLVDSARRPADYDELKRVSIAIDIL